MLCGNSGALCYVRRVMRELDLEERRLLSLLCLVLLLVCCVLCFPEGFLAVLSCLLLIVSVMFMFCSVFFSDSKEIGVLCGAKDR